ncbi:MAG TPA: hypothetical protein VKV28_07900 [Candidatus Binataceae bacterium]|nr:hypothetical protein [Candidatus Binataceae bacterium]
MESLRIIAMVLALTVTSLSAASRGVYSQIQAFCTPQLAAWIIRGLAADNSDSPAPSPPDFAKRQSPHKLVILLDGAKIALLQHTSMGFYSNPLNIPALEPKLAPPGSDGEPLIFQAC